MKKKINNTKNLSSFASRFLVGFVIALTASLSAFEWTVVNYERTLKSEEQILNSDDEILPPITYKLSSIII